MKRQWSTEVKGKQRAYGVSGILRLTVRISVFGMLLVFSSTAFAQRSWSGQQPGYYHTGSQVQSFQTQGNRTDYRGLINGGVTAGPVGVQGFNSGHTYSYSTRRTEYRSVPGFYYSNGNSCSSKIYNEYELPNGSPVYDQWGQPYRPSGRQVMSAGRPRSFRRG